MMTAEDVITLIDSILTLALIAGFIGGAISFIALDFLNEMGEKEEEGNKMKPYFLPLKKEYYMKIEDGIQRSEIRPNNHRGWNINNIFEGRVINLSYGYGKKRRMLKTVVKTIITNDLKMANISKEHIEAVEKIYGQNRTWLIAIF